MTKSEIMKKAREMTKASVAKFGGDYLATFAAALRLAWQDSKEPQTVQELLQCPPEKLYDYLRRAASKCPRWAEQQTRPMLDENGEPVTDEETGKPIRISCPGTWARWMQPASSGGLARESWEDAVTMVANEAYTILIDLPADMDSRTACRKAAVKACQRLNRQTIDKPSRRLDDPSSLDDPDFNRTMTTRRDDPETVALARAALEAAPADDADKIIINGIADGLKQAVIAAHLGISQGAVARRLGRIRARHAAEQQHGQQTADDRREAAAITAWLDGNDLHRPAEYRPDNASSSTGGHRTAADPRAAAWSFSRPVSAE